MTAPAHARIAPSSLQRSTECPRSVREVEHLPQTVNPAADEGTMQHGVAAECLLNGGDPGDYIGTKVTLNDAVYEYTEEMADAIRPAIDWIREQPGELFIEQRVSLNSWMPGQYGTLDVAILNIAEAMLTILDFKFGYIPQFAHKTKQLPGYGLGFLQDIVGPRGITIKTIRIIVEQPRSFAGGRFWKHFDYTFDELMAFGETLRLVAEAVDHPDTPFNPGPVQCEFCPLKFTAEGCAAHTTWLFNSLGIDRDMLRREIDAKDFGPITPTLRYQVVQNMRPIEKYLEKLAKDSLDAVQAGEPDPGSKLGVGREGNREWEDALDAELILTAALGDAASNKTLKSPAQAEAALKRTRKSAGNPTALAYLREMWVRAPGKPTLMPADDDRPDYVDVDQHLAELEDLD